MFIVGDTLTMGSKKAQEAYFNAQIQKTNYQYAAAGASSTAAANAENAAFKAKSETFNIFSRILNGAQTVPQMIGNIFDSKTWGIR